MKRTFLLLAVAVAMVMGAKAQTQTATLQRGNSTTYYYGEDAFKEAYNSANDGSIITLSAGYFNTVDSITKQITIRGNGYTGEKTVIGSGKVYPYPFSSLYICASNVKIDGLCLESGLIPINSNLKNLYISHSYIPGYWPYKKATNVTIDNCKLEVIGGYNYTNHCVKNSFVNYTPIGGLIGNGEGYHFFNCIVGNFRPTDFYRNCIINVNNSDGTITFSDDKEYLYNVFICGVSTISTTSIETGYHASSTIDESTRYSTPTLPDTETSNIKGNSVALFDDIFNYTNEENPLYAPIITTITGDDGTVVGPYGGTGFSENPSIPRITESKIDTYTDGEGKLNVKVKVEVGQ